MPKRSEAKQCASCPFKQGNDKEFGSIVTALRKKADAIGMSIPPLDEETVDQARAAVIFDVIGPGGTGDFACHATVYGPGMEIRPESEWRQCPGASEIWRKCGNGS
jgi:hypothetical protein